MLKNIAKISSGYLFRAKPDYVESGGYPVILMKDVVPGRCVDWQSLLRVRLDEVKTEYLVRQGDVLLRAKGENHLAVYVGNNVPENTVVSSQLIIIRPKNTILPEYLAWYINQHPAQRYIETQSVGTNIKHLSLSKISELPICFPSIEVQRTIVAVCRLRQRETYLVEKIKRMRQRLIDAILVRKINHKTISKREL